MLLREYFGGRHEAGLVAVVERHEHAHEGHDGFAGAHIALHEAVHLPARSQVGADFADHSFLRAGEFEGQFFLVKTVEKVADFIKNKTARSVFPAGADLQEPQLQKKQLFNFHRRVAASSSAWVSGKCIFCIASQRACSR